MLELKEKKNPEVLIWKSKCSIYRLHPAAHCWILCGVITGAKKRKVNIWAGFRNYRLTVIKLPQMPSELSGFKIVSSLKVGQPR